MDVTSVCVEESNAREDRWISLIYSNLSLSLCFSTVPDDNMSGYFVCKNGQNVSWTSVCDGRNQCTDGSDERHCKFCSSRFDQQSSSHRCWLFVGYCQGDVYACLQGNNVSCRVACGTYGRVTCLTYQNTRACDQYLRERKQRRYERRSTSSIWFS